MTTPNDDRRYDILAIPDTQRCLVWWHFPDDNYNVNAINVDPRELGWIRENGVHKLPVDFEERVAVFTPDEFRAKLQDLGIGPETAA
jgi:hypothetical protein